MRIIDQEQSPETIDLAFRSLYRTGAAAAWIAALLFRRNMDAEWAMLRSAGIIPAGAASAPDSVIGWFSLLQQQPLPGLLLLNLFDLLNYVLVGWIFLAVIIALRRAQPFWSLAAGSAVLTGVFGYLASNQAVPLLSLSRQYLTADPVQRNMILAAGQALLAVQQNNSYAGSGLYPSFFLVSLAGLILSIAMLRDGIFERTTGCIGILANTFGLSYYLLHAFAPALTFLPLSISALFLLAWYLLLGRRLWWLASSDQRSISYLSREPRCAGL